MVSYIRDRNGNKITFDSYDGLNRVTQITDSLNRRVNITYAPGTVGSDEIRFTGFNGASRVISVNYNLLSTALREDQCVGGCVPKSKRDLFPELTDVNDVTDFNPRVVTSVTLPDGRSYMLKYNVYGEIARVELPTGGVYEYDWPHAPNLPGPEFPVPPGTYASGVLCSAPGTGGPYPADCPGEWHEIWRRIGKRRVCSTGDCYDSSGNPTFDSEETYTFEFDSPISRNSDLSTRIDVRDSSGNLLKTERHYYYGNPIGSMFPPNGLAYPFWREGQEYRSELGVGSAVVKRINHTPVQRAPVTWWPPTSGNDAYPVVDTSSNGAPPNDPRIVETETSWPNVTPNRVAKVTYDYDSSEGVNFNRVTKVWEYDYGNDLPGSLIRRTETQYFPNYQNDSAIHLRDLPSRRSVFDGAGAEKSRTEYQYDNYTAVSPYELAERYGISQLQSGDGSKYYVTRGNVTKVSRFLGYPPTTEHSTLYQYDVAGNIVAIIDPRGNRTDFDFVDNFEDLGGPDGEARTNTAPGPLVAVGQVSFAFPRAVTNALVHTSYTQYDYYTGKPVDAEDANGVVTSTWYNDPLERPRQQIRAANITATPAVTNQTTFTYDDDNRIVTSQSDRDTYLDSLLKTQTVYDGLGRTVENRTFEDVVNYITIQTSYDARGRIWYRSNPYRPASEGPAWTIFGYDALDRITSVSHPGGGVTATVYSGDRIDVTDPAGKAQRTFTDALGRLKQVIEDPAGLNYSTGYTYDVLDNLTQVTQGTQTRQFNYDSVGRLTSAILPEYDGTVTYTYDANGNLRQKIDPRSNVSITYD